MMNADRPVTTLEPVEHDAGRMDASSLHARRGKILRRVALVAILLAAVALRAFHLTLPSLGQDETSTFLKVSAPTWSDFARKLNEGAGGTPLYPFCARLVLKVTQDPKLAMRLPVAAAGVLAVYLVYILGRGLFSNATGLAAAFLLAVSPFHVYYSQEGRFYGFLIVFSVLFVITFVHAARRDRLRDWITLALVVAAGFYAHYFTALVEGAVALAVAARAAVESATGRHPWRRGGQLRILGKLALCGMAAVIMFSPWLAVGLGRQHRWFWRHDGGVDALWSTFMALAGGGCSAAVLVVLLVLAALRTAKERNRRAVMLWTICVVGPCAVGIAARVFNYWFHAKYLVFLLPFVSVLGAWGMEWAAAGAARLFGGGMQGIARQWALCGMCLVMAVACTPGLAATYRTLQTKTEFYDMMVYVWENARPSDTVIAGPFWGLWAFKTHRATEERDIRVVSAAEAYANAEEIAGNADGRVLLITRALPNDWKEYELAYFKRLYVLTRAADALSANQWRAKITDYLAQWATDPRNDQRFRIYFSQAEIHAFQGRLDEAVRLWQKAHDSSEGFSRYDSAAGLCLAAGDVAQAEALLEKEISERPDNGRAHYMLATLLHKAHRHDEALVEFEQAAALLPRDAEVLGLLGATYMKVGRLDEARSVLKRAVALDPETPWIRKKYSQTRALIRRRDMDEGS